MKLEIDSFNSDIFGIVMANLILDKELLESRDVSDIVNDAKKRGIKHLCVKTNVNDKRNLYALFDNGFYLVDTLITYEIPVLKYGIDTDIIRPYNDCDKERLMRIAKSGFAIDRFHSDPNLPKEKSDRYYEKWTENLCEGMADKIFVVDINDQVMGFQTLKYSDNTARFVLAAIDSEAQGKGYYNLLMKYIINSLNGTDLKLLLGTQLGNMASLRTLSRLSGIPMSVTYVLHKSLM